MSIPFNYRIDGTAIIPTYATDVVMEEVVAGERAEMLEIAYRHGVYVADRHWQKAYNFDLRIYFPFDEDPDLFRIALHGFNTLVYGGKKTLTRYDHDVAADLQCEVIAVDETTQGSGSGRFVWPYSMWNLRGYWEEASAQTETDVGLGASGTIGPFTVGGDVRTEPKLTITCTADGATPAVEHVATGAKLTVVGSYVNTDVIVIDVANDSVTLNGVAAKNILRITRGYLMELDPAAVSLAFTSDSGTWTVDTEWRDRYR